MWRIFGFCFSNGLNGGSPSHWSARLTTLTQSQLIKRMVVFLTFFTSKNDEKPRLLDTSLAIALVRNSDSELAYRRETLKFRKMISNRFDIVPWIGLQKWSFALVFSRGVLSDSLAVLWFASIRRLPVSLMLDEPQVEPLERPSGRPHRMRNLILRACVALSLSLTKFSRQIQATQTRLPRYSRCEQQKHLIIANRMNTQWARLNTFSLFSASSSSASIYH